MATTDKDTIYVDIDDEITGIIDKVKNSNGKVIALVLPKRASVFQSIVNMKLLKRAVDGSKKNLVLITSEAGLLPLAGAAGIHVAKTLTSRPEIPTAPTAAPDNDEAVDEDEAIETGEPEIDQNEPVGKLANDAAPAAAAADGVETLTLDNEEPVAAGAADAAKDASDKKAGKADKVAKNKKLKVPNFNKFRLILIIGAVVIIILIVLFLILNSALSKATIKIKTNATNVNASLNLTLTSDDSSFDATGNDLPAKYVQYNKTYTQTVNTTGQKNEGNAATGSVNMTDQECEPNDIGAPASIPAGTGLSNGGNTYITQQNASFNPSQISKNCVTYTANDISITAQSPGSAFNVSGVTFSVAGNSGVSASGSATGGTDNIVQTVNQADINSAKSKINTNNSSSAKSSLESQIQGDGLYPLTATFNTGSTNTTSSASVGEAASNVTVTESITYTMFGVNKGQLKTLVNNSIDGQIDTSKQSILDNGLSSASYSVDNLTSDGGQVSMNVKAIAGPQLNISQIKQQAEGHKAGDISSTIETNPNVTNVQVSFSPFWVGSAPKNPSKINVDIVKPANN
jgi:hypothetical protein